jgi:hypothetical protein
MLVPPVQILAGCGCWSGRQRLKVERAVSRHKVPALAKENMMNEDALNTSVRKFLKKVGITSQREIEKTVREAVANGNLKGNEALTAKATISVSKLNLSFEVDGAIELE